MKLITSSTLALLSLSIVSVGCDMFNKHDDSSKNMHKHESTTRPSDNTSSNMDMSHSMHMAMANVDHAIAVLHPTKGNDVHGTVHFMQSGDSVKITADVEGLAPNSKHGFHIHEFGDCSDPEGKSAGGHYDPAGTKHHGMPDADPAQRHGGDMGNLQADGSGKAHVELTLAGVSISVNNAILGRAVIVHAKEDNGGQPTGNAGDRMACGVIGAAK